MPTLQKKYWFYSFPTSSVLIKTITTAVIDALASAQLYTRVAPVSAMGKQSRPAVSAIMKAPARKAVMWILPLTASATSMEMTSISPSPW